MELENLTLGESHGQNQLESLGPFLLMDSEANSDDLSHGSEWFRVQDMGAPKTSSANKKLSWLRSQILGGEAEFSSPFGTRRITYADHTASGRGLHYIENYIVSNVLPFYGELNRP